MSTGTTSYGPILGNAGNISDEDFEAILAIMEEYGVDFEPAMQLLNSPEEVRSEFNIAEAFVLDPEFATRTIQDNNAENLIKDLKFLYNITKADALAFVKSSDPTYDRETLCAMYILETINEQNKSNGSNSEAVSASNAGSSPNVLTGNSNNSQSSAGGAGCVGGAGVVAAHEEDSIDGHSDWNCAVCTYLNNGAMSLCEICDNSR
jgi:hypothetical protein